MPNTNDAQLSEGLFNPNTGLGLESRIEEIEIIIDSFKDNAADGEILFRVDEETIDGVTNPTAAELKTFYDSFDAADTLGNDFVLAKSAADTLTTKKFSNALGAFGAAPTDNDLVVRTSGAIAASYLDLGSSILTTPKIALYGTAAGSDLYSLGVSSYSFNYNVINTADAHRFYCGGNSTGTGQEVVRIGARTPGSVTGTALTCIDDIIAQSNIEVGVATIGTADKSIIIWGDDATGANRWASYLTNNNKNTGSRNFNFPDVSGTLRVGASKFDEWDLTDGTSIQIITGHGTTAPKAKFVGGDFLTSTLAQNTPASGDGQITYGANGYSGITNDQVVLRDDATTLKGVTHTSAAYDSGVATANTICSRDANGLLANVFLQAGGVIAGLGTFYTRGHIEVVNPVGANHSILIATESANTSGDLSFFTDIEGGSHRGFNINSKYTEDLISITSESSTSALTEVVNIKSADNAVHSTAKGEVMLHGSLAFDNTVYSGAAGTFKTSVVATDPTADRTITLPNATGTVALEGAVSLADLILWFQSFSAMTNGYACIKQSPTIPTPYDHFGQIGPVTSDNTAGSLCSRDGDGSSRFNSLYLSDSNGTTTTTLEASIYQAAYDATAGVNKTMDGIRFIGRFALGTTTPVLDNFGNINIYVPKAKGGNPFNASTNADAVLSFLSGSDDGVNPRPFMSGVGDCDRYTYAGGLASSNTQIDDNRGSNFTTNSVPAGYDKEDAFFKAVSEECYLQQEALPTTDYHAYKSNFTFTKNLICGTPQMNGGTATSTGGVGCGATRLQSSAIFHSLQGYSGIGGFGVNSIVGFDTNSTGLAAYESGYTYSYQTISKYSAVAPTGGVDRNVSTGFTWGGVSYKQVKFGEANNYATLQINYSHYISPSGGWVKYQFAAHGYNPVTNAVGWTTIGDPWVRYTNVAGEHNSYSMCIRFIVPSNMEYFSHFCLMANANGGTGLTAPVPPSPAATVYSNWGDYLSLSITNAPYYEIAS